MCYHIFIKKTLTHQADLPPRRFAYKLANFCSLSKFISFEGKNIVKKMEGNVVFKVRKLFCWTINLKLLH